MQLSNWGNYPFIETEMKSPYTLEKMREQALIAQNLIARGNGRCYGDSALNDNLVLSCMRLDKMIAFDEESGVLIAEAGVLLSEILDSFAPRGWFLAVTPGTKLISIGGAIASDVHGKNHHVAGCFSSCVVWFDLLVADGQVVRCSAKENIDLFNATCGGQGLTGIILKAAIYLEKVQSVWIDQTSVKAKNLEEIMNAFEQYEETKYSVAWIDCLQKGDAIGRSILTVGDFAPKEKLKANTEPYKLKKGLPLSVPLDFPSFALNTLSVKAFNALYYGKAKSGTHKNIVSYNTFFYPLDSIDSWNKIYGKRGFTQYQFVIPTEAAKEGLSKILDRIARSGQGSFLAVLKLFGEQENAKGNISFPQKGYTLALDFPITQKLFPLLNELDAMVFDYGGRHYLTKDSRLSAEGLRKGYGELLDDFLEVKRIWDPENKFTSTQAKRLELF